MSYNPLSVKADKYETVDRDLTKFYDMIRSEPYFGGLKESPFLKSFFILARQLEKEFKYEEAIEKYKDILSHPKATLPNKTAAHFLIANNIYALSRFNEAEKHYTKALELV